MTTLSTRINGQSDYRPTGHARAAWREEMLGEFLSQMRRHREVPPTPTAPAQEVAATPGKGYYINIYV